MATDNSQSPAVIDATDALVLAPEAATPALTIQQQEQLERCAFHLHRLGRRIAARENDLIYLYVEAGFYLLKAQDAHRCATVAHRSDGTFHSEDAGFRGWLASAPEADQTPHRTAYRYMQAARNAGLTAESLPVALEVLRAEKRLANQTLTGLCRKPVDKTDQEAELHEVTPEEAEAERLADIRESWRKWGEVTTEIGIDKQTWMEGVSEDERKALCGIAHELYRLLKDSLRRAKPSPALPAPAQP